MRKLLISAVLVLFGATGADAQDARTWIFDDSSDAVMLQFGTPDSDDLVIALSCEPQTKRMRIFEYAASKTLMPGRTIPLKLANGTVRVEYAGQCVASEMDGAANLEVSTPVDPKLFGMLKAGPTLTVDVAGNQLTIPLKGAAPQLAAFEKACLPRR